ncbi:hypothetical protein ACHAWF_005438 [Thalassiosira exigua]
MDAASDRRRPAAPMRRRGGTQGRGAAHDHPPPPPRRRRRPRGAAARALFLASLAAAAVPPADGGGGGDGPSTAGECSASLPPREGSDPSRSQCPDVALLPPDDGEERAPRVVATAAFAFEPRRPPPPPPTILAASPREDPRLGDGVRSAEASGVFFDYLDTDGDGAIEPEEVARFLQDEIGGERFDTQLEVDGEVGAIMERLDQDRNDGLEMSDMLDYWMQLESLLTAEEVADWVVYSVQLPSSIGRIFLENGITGYDFLEIVDNGGEVLRNELGIDKASFRNKIVRQMQARMLGIGSPPGNPRTFASKLESCSAVTLSWKPSAAGAFPVHSYRVQRRSIDLFGNRSGEAASAAAASSSHLTNNFDSSPNSDWKTVFVGSDDEFVDSKLDTGHNYMYRIQAWNSVGRSGWETLDLSRALKKQRCSSKPPGKTILATERGAPTTQGGMEDSFMSTPKRVLWGVVAVVQFVYHTTRIVLALFALLAGIMRFRRATATSSSAAKAVLPFPRFWKAINRASMKVLGSEPIPRTMLGDKEALIRQEQLHDDRMMATGLRGYARTARVASDIGPGKAELKGINRRGNFKKEKSHSTGDLHSSTVSFGPPKEVIIPRSEQTPQRFPWMRPTPKRNGNDSFRGSNASTASSVSRSTAFPSHTSTASKSAAKSDRPHYNVTRSLSIDENNHCSECRKKFKIGRRYKHHCCRCMATFCHKHGRTTHSNFTSCRVPGDCICNSCLRVIAERSERSERSEPSRRTNRHKSSLY